ncbi:MAG: PEP-CTERM sorting domain-containing protein [Pirellulales bacterium]|nr:PEP-CTERM sorting domain-containing protein [Pirellulales bacterium]
MQRTTHRVLWGAVLAIGILALSSHAAMAETMLGIDDFDYVYDCDTPSVPSGWAQVGTALVYDGVDYVSYNTTADVNLKGYLISYGTVAGNAWQQVGITPSTGYTAEIRAKINSIADSSDDIAYAMLTVEGTQLASLTVRANSVMLYGAGEFSTPNNVGEFHTFRVTQDTDKKLTVYRDGIVVPGLEDVTGYAYTQNYINFGDLGTNTAADVNIDYVGFTKGAYAPVPEPTTWAMLICGALMLWIRRR